MHKIARIGQIYWLENLEIALGGDYQNHEYLTPGKTEKLIDLKSKWGINTIFLPIRGVAFPRPLAYIIDKNC